MAVRFSNNAFATLASSLTNVATTASLSSGQGSRFPSLGAGDYFFATLVDASNNQEIIKVTARTNDTITIVRGQDGTSGRAFSAGDRVELRVVAASLEAIYDDAQTQIDDLDSTKAPINSPAFTGFPTVPTAALGDATGLIASTSFVNATVNTAIPAGIIAMWSGSIASIPIGWYLCNGLNGTPDLRDKFVVGAGSSYSVAGTGGSKDAVVVSHTHSVVGTVASRSITGQFRVGGLNQSPDGTVFSAGGDTGARPGLDSNSGSQHIINFNATHDHSFSGSASTTGSSATDANLPPYYALAYIMKG